MLKNKPNERDSYQMNYQESDSVSDSVGMSSGCMMPS